jgi:prevent-host-death family protein
MSETLNTTEDEAVSTQDAGNLASLTTSPIEFPGGKLPELADGVSLEVEDLPSVSFLYAKKHMERLVSKANRTGIPIVITRSGGKPVVLVPLRYGK